jgi:hypothetical protein
MDGIHFGTIGIKIGDKISFEGNEDVFIVSSGDGTPDNGGTLVYYEDKRELYRFRPLDNMTERLMGIENIQCIEDIEGLDLWSLWFYKGKSLRSIYDEKIGERVKSLH